MNRRGPLNLETLDLARLEGHLLCMEPLRGLAECTFPPHKNIQVVHPDTRAALESHGEKRPL